MDIYCRKHNNLLYPDSAHDQEKLGRIREGTPVKMTLKQERNYEFFKKWMALLRYAYDAWEPDEHNLVGEKNLERFRKDITILAGYYESHVRLDGSTRISAKSVSFAEMSEDDFAELYQKTIDVILKYVLQNYTEDDLTRVMNEVLDFA
jgi:hypothetical protein